jgi:hypothetical protein
MRTRHGTEHAWHERRCPQRLPIDVLIEPVLGLRLCHRVQVRERFELVIPAGWPMTLGDGRRMARLADLSGGYGAGWRRGRRQCNMILPANQAAAMRSAAVSQTRG